MAAKTGASWTFSREALALANGTLREQLDIAVAAVAKEKHGKSTDDINMPQLLEMLGNTLNKMMANKIFGYFEDARRKPFSRSGFSGTFRNMKGPMALFIDALGFEGPDEPPAEYVFVFDIVNKRGLPLFPMMFCDKIGERSSEGTDLFVYDIHRDNEAAYRAIRQRQELKIGANSDDYKIVWEEISRRFERDEELLWVDGFEFSRKEPQSI